MFGREEKVSAIRLTAVQYVVLFIFLLLAYGLWRLQVMASGHYAQLAEQNCVRNVPILAPRGKILDREGRTIVDNYPSFSALLLRDSTRDLKADADAIAKGLHLNPDEVRQRIRRVSSMPQYQPMFLKDDITPDELAFIAAHKNELPELETIMAHRRLYPRNGFMAHLIGYVGEVSEDMLNQPQFELYNPGDVVGVSGVEKQYNSILMGRNGSRRAIVNSHGREVGRLDETPAEPGKQLKLTVDLDLQIAAEQALNGRNGAIVAMNPRTGEILAMVSRPTFDPNDFAVQDFAGRVDQADRRSRPSAAEQGDSGATGARVGVQDHYGDGRIAGRHSAEYASELRRRRQFLWPLFQVLGGCRTPHAWRGRYQQGHYQSCDVFFYTLAEKLGIDRIAKYATPVGLGQKTGIDLPQEVSGVMPSEEWKIRNFKQKWYAGETISVGIGQGAVAATPIQLARAIGAIASGGLLVRPHVINPTDLAAECGSGGEYARGSAGSASIPDNWELITDAMSNVVDPIGTAPSAHLQGIDFAGKTGSAQTISNALKAKLGAGRQEIQGQWLVRGRRAADAIRKLSCVRCSKKASMDISPPGRRRK